MKKLTIFLAFIAFSSMFMQAEAQQNAAGDSSKMKMEKSKAPSMGGMPYTASYSSNFTMGKKENAKMILQLYKDFENADWSKDKWFSDTVVVFLPDGSVLQGKDKVLEAFKNQRSSLANTSFQFSAFIPLTSADRKQDWVATWGTQTYNMKDSTSATSADFQDIWRFNKAKQVDFIKFFAAKTSMPQQ